LNTLPASKQAGSLNVGMSLFHDGVYSSNATVLQLTHWVMSVEIIWHTSTTRDVKTIFSVTSTGIYL
jgi:hypothetical protein